jgi:hypothetical protein
MINGALAYGYRKDLAYGSGSGIPLMSIRLFSYLRGGETSLDRIGTPCPSTAIAVKVLNLA